MVEDSQENLLNYFLKTMEKREFKNGDEYEVLPEGFRQATIADFFIKVNGKYPKKNGLPIPKEGMPFALKSFFNEKEPFDIYITHDQMLRLRTWNVIWSYVWHKHCWVYDESLLK